jgi:hypothetical protein
MTRGGLMTSTYGFDSLTPRFEEIREVAKLVSVGDLARLPRTLLLSASQVFENVEGRRRELEAFVPAPTSNPVQDRNNIVGNFQGATVQFIQGILPVLTFRRRRVVCYRERYR